MTMKNELVLYVVEVERTDGSWTPAWSGDGAASVDEHSAEQWRHDDSLLGENTRVAVYVRRESK